MIWRVAFVIVALAMIVGGLTDREQLRFSLDGIDKPVHFLAFFGLALLGAMGWPKRRVLFLLLLPLAGVALETAQTLTPHRQFDWEDALMNAAGVGVAVALSVAITRWLALKAR